MYSLSYLLRPEPLCKPIALFDKTMLFIKSMGR